MYGHSDSSVPMSAACHESPCDTDHPAVSDRAGAACRSGREERPSLTLLMNTPSVVQPRLRPYGDILRGAALAPLWDERLDSWPHGSFR